MEKAYKFRIYPTKEQERMFQENFGCVRFVYNYYLGMRIDKYRKDKSDMRYNQCSANLTQLKKSLIWLQNADSTSLQTSLRNLDNAFLNFFSNKKFGYPKFKSKRKSKKSFTTKSASIKIVDSYINLPKVKLVKCKFSRKVEGKILNATVSQSKSGKYYVSLCCRIEDIPQFEPAHKSVGIDLGLKDFLITSDDEKFDNQKFLSKSEKLLKRVQKKFSKSKTSGKNHEKLRIKLAKRYEKVSNQRKDYLHKLSAMLIKRYDIICLESLKVQNMIKNHRLAKSIHDVSWSEFIRMLQYKANWYGKCIQRVDTYYPSSQLCSCCGYQNTAIKDLSIRNWTCPNCNASHDRDINASINILNQGLKLLNA